MTTNRAGATAGFLLVIGLVALGVWGAAKAPTTSAPATTTTSTTTTAPATTTTAAPTTVPPTTAPPSGALTGDVCKLLDRATAGATITLDATAPGLVFASTGGVSGEGGGDAHPTATGVTVTGRWSGDVRCHVCNGWSFTGLDVRDGSLRLIGGGGWSVTDSHLDGGGRGANSVLGVGSTDAVDSLDGNPHDWLIARVTAEHNGCKPAEFGGDYANRAHAVYIIGKNGQPMHGIIEDSTFRHDGCGDAVKIGGTGLFAVWDGMPDAADDVTLRRSVIVNEGGPGAGVLVSTDSDFVRVEANDITAEGPAFNLSGPFDGRYFAAVDNRVTAAPFLLAKVWNVPHVFYASQLGSKFVTYPLPGPCPAVGLCSGNT
jgi:hypothetical protein